MIALKTDYFKIHGDGLCLVNAAIKELDIKITGETSIEELHCAHNAITAFALDKILEKLKVQK